MRKKSAQYGGTFYLSPTVLVIAFLVLPGTLLAGQAKVSQTSANVLTLDLQFGAPLIQDLGDGTKRVDLEGLPISAAAPGYPRLPVANYNVVLPPNTTVDRIEISGASWLVPGSHLVEWGQMIAPTCCCPSGDRVDRDYGVYASNETYPAETVVLGGEGYFRGYRLAALTVQPTLLVPATGVLSVSAQMSIQLHLKPLGEVPAPDLAVQDLPVDRRDLARFAVNPEMASAYPATALTESWEPLAIIAPGSFMWAYAPLAQHRRRMGINTGLYSVESLLAANPGRDRAEQLRNGIKRLHEIKGTIFFLLGGDDVDDSGSLLVPYRTCSLPALHHDPQVSLSGAAPCDIYYAGLDGTWDNDNDGIWGEDHWGEESEIDYYPDVIVGRATVDDYDEAARFVSKVIAAEPRPFQSDSSQEALHRDRRLDILLFGAVLDYATHGKWVKESAAAFIPKGYNIERDYDGTHPQEFLNRGPHIANFVCHGNKGFMGGMDRTFARTMGNVTPIFFFSTACEVGGFDEPYRGYSDVPGEALVEQMLFSQRCALGAVMHVREGIYDPGNFEAPSSNRFDRTFFEQLFGGATTYGQAFDLMLKQYAAMAMTDDLPRWVLLSMSYFGDPASLTQVGSPEDWIHAPLKAFDLDRDGAMEIIYATKGGEVRVSRYSGMDWDPEQPVWSGATGGAIYGAPALGDVNNDHLVEVAALSDDGYVYLWHSDGTPFPTPWPIKIAAPYPSSGIRAAGGPAIGDIDMDGRWEIVIGSRDGKLHALKVDGSEVKGFPVNVGAGMESTPALADIIGDIRPEIIIGTSLPLGPSSKVPYVYVIQADGKVAPGWPRGPMAKPFITSPIIGDLDFDGDWEIVIGNGDELLAFEHGGSWYFVSHYRRFQEDQPILADIHGDGRLEILSPVLDPGYNSIRLHEFDGGIGEWGMYPGAYTLPWRRLIAGDVDGDSDADLVMTRGTYAPGIGALDNDGRFLSQLFPFGWGEVTGEPVLTDFDGDGRQEIVFGNSEGRIQVMRLNSYSSSNWEWDTFQRDPLNSGVYYRFDVQPLPGSPN